VYGKAGSFKVEAFVRDMPNLLSTDAKSIFNGVGSNNLTLAGGLVPGGSSSGRSRPFPPLHRRLGSELSATSRASPCPRISRRSGACTSTPATKSARVPARMGDRSSSLWRLRRCHRRTVKPIDDNTVNITAGARYAGSEWRFDIGYSGSIYRDRYLAYTFQQPFALGPAFGGTAAPITQGQMSMEPDNEYHNLHVTATRKLPLNGEASLTAGAGEMNQNDTLIPPTNCQGVFGLSTDGTFNVGPSNPQLFPCGQWNTTAALSQQTANMLIVTNLLQGSIVLQRPAT